MAWYSSLFSKKGSSPNSGNQPSVRGQGGSAAVSFDRGEYQRVLEQAVDEGDSDALILRASALHHLGRHKDALQALDKSISMAGDKESLAGALERSAEVLLAIGRFAEAEKRLSQALQASPDRAAPHRIVAECWLRRGVSVTQTTQRARQAVEIEQTVQGLNHQTKAHSLSESLVTLAWALAREGREPEVEETVKEALNMPVNSVPVKAGVHFRAGLAYSTLGRAADAKAYFRRVTEIDPQGYYGNQARGMLA